MKISATSTPSVDALVDLPFALPTAVAGIALTALYACSAILSLTAMGTAAGGLAVTNYFCIR
jgi:ABC-type sulfate transport system permease component